MRQKEKLNVQLDNTLTSGPLTDVFVPENYFDSKNSTKPQKFEKYEPVISDSLGATDIINDFHAKYYEKPSFED